MHKGTMSINTIKTLEKDVMSTFLPFLTGYEANYCDDYQLIVIQQFSIRNIIG